MEKISVIVITKNEEKNIKSCLESVLWADEIILVDAESTDKTRDLAKEFTNKIFINKWEGFVNQKKYALSLVKNEWILSIDADERISKELEKEIQTNNLNAFNGYKIRRQNFFFGKEITSCGWNKDYQLRLFKKSKVDLTDKLVHEGFYINGEVGLLENVLIHNTFSSIKNYLSKVNHYTTLQAKESFMKKKRINGWIIFAHIFSAFFRYYISLKGFKDGFHGLVISMINSLSTLLTYVKIWELQNQNK